MKLAIVCDRPAASQHVHLLRPLRRLRAKEACALWQVSEADAGGTLSAQAIAERVRSMRPDALIFSRYGGPHAEAFVSAAEQCGAPIIMHLDDDLFEIPADLGAHKVKQHMRPERLHALTTAANAARLLYISTEPLAAKLKERGFAAPMRVGALQSCADPSELAPLPECSERIRIGYQGTSSHALDLAMIVEPLARTLAERPGVDVAFFGSIEPPAQLAGFGDRVRRIPPAGDYDAFLDRLKRESWHVGLAPLRDTEFNSYRTYTKWTEYSVAGAAVIASDCAPFRALNSRDLVLLTGADEWRANLLALIDDAPRREAMARAAQSRLVEELTLEKQERQLIEALAEAGTKLRF